MTGRGEFSEREGRGSLFHSGRHRRLAKAGSPATARGCGSSPKALLAAAVASGILLMRVAQTVLTETATQAATETVTKIGTITAAKAETKT